LCLFWLAVSVDLGRPGHQSLTFSWHFAAVTLRVEAAKRAAATAAVAAAAPAASTGLLLQPELAFSSGTYLMVPIYFILAFWPRSRVVSARADCQPRCSWIHTKLPSTVPVAACERSVTLPTPYFSLALNHTHQHQLGTSSAQDFAVITGGINK
jgi:hypothetical protein